MAIALRGSLNDLTAAASNGANVTITFDTITPPLEDDVVVVFGAHGTDVTTIDLITSGYTLIDKHESTAPIFGAWYKFMGSTPDLTVVIDGGGDAQDGVALACYVISGVDTTTPLDQTTVSVGPTTSTNPDCGSITTQTDDAWVFAMAGSDVRDTGPGTVSGYVTQLNANRNDTNDVTIAGARLEKTTFGAEDPPAWSSWSSSTWYAITAAFKPASGGPTPAITDVDDEDFFDGETGVTITGTDFEASQGSGIAVIGSHSTFSASTIKITQDDVSWSDTSIDIDIVLGTNIAHSLWMYVTNNTGNTNSSGFAITVHGDERWASTLPLPTLLVKSRTR